MSVVDPCVVATTGCHELILPQIAKRGRTSLRSKLKMVRPKRKMMPNLDMASATFWRLNRKSDQ